MAKNPYKSSKAFDKFAKCPDRISIALDKTFKSPVETVKDQDGLTEISDEAANGPDRMAITIAVFGLLRL